MSQYSGMAKLHVACANTVRTRGTSLAARPAMCTGSTRSPAASWMDLAGARALARADVPPPPPPPPPLRGESASSPPSKAAGSEKSPMSSPRQRAAAWRTRGCASDAYGSTPPSTSRTRGANRRLSPDATMASASTAARRDCQRGDDASGVSCALSTGHSVLPTPMDRRSSAAAPARTAS